MKGKSGLAGQCCISLFDAPAILHHYCGCALLFNWTPTIRNCFERRIFWVDIQRLEPYLVQLESHFVRDFWQRRLYKERPSVPVSVPKAIVSKEEPSITKFYL
jgi:hypothetical protein